MPKEREDEQSRCREAEACLKRGEYQEALRRYRELLETSDDRESLMLALAWAYHDGGDLAGAVACFELLFARELERPLFSGFAYDELVRIYREGRQYDRLVSVCERAAASLPGDPGILQSLAEAYLAAGRTGRAKETLNRIIDDDPDHPPAFCLLGEALIAEGAFPEAEEAYGRAAAIDPDGAWRFYGRMADACVKAGEYGRAGAALQKCIALRDEPIYHCLFGACLVGQGKIAEARKAYERAIALAPSQEVNFLHRWGNDLASAGYHREAIEIFAAACRGEENNRFSRLRLSQLRASLRCAKSARDPGHPRCP